MQHIENWALCQLTLSPTHWKVFPSLLKIHYFPIDISHGKMFTNYFHKFFIESVRKGNIVLFSYRKIWKFSIISVRICFPPCIFPVSWFGGKQVGNSFSIAQTSHWFTVGKTFVSGSAWSICLMITFILFYSWTYGNSSSPHFFCISAARKPIVAAVESFALGGGFEIALASV